ncbi:MAG TPA: NnrS family protein [Fibrobacteria bacterium]|nr:NnrS family protein [Fibrobacteria bacterium]
MIQAIGHGRISAFRLEPFRLLFPLGYFFLVLGLGVWSAGLAGDSPHRETVHALLLGDGFLFAFAAGILLSEVPRWQGTGPLGGVPLSAFMVFLCAAGLSAAQGALFFTYAFHSLALLVLAAYLGYGWLISKGRRQPGPILAFSATVIAMAFDFFGIMAESGAFPREAGRGAAVAGLQIFLYLFAMACVRWSKETGLRAGLAYGIPWAAAWLVFSFLLEIAAAYSIHSEWLVRVSHLIRFLWLGLFLGARKGYRPLFADLPVSGRILKAGAAFLFAGTLAAAQFPGWSVALNHVAYLLGFAWILLAGATGLIAGRLAATPRKPGRMLLRFLGVSLAAAAILRLAAEAVPEYRSSILAIAASLAMLPMLAWAVFQFPRLADWDARRAGSPGPKEP